MKKSLINMVAAILLIGDYAFLHNVTEADSDASSNSVVEETEFSPNAIPVTLVNTFRQYKHITYYSPLFDFTYTTYYVNQGYREAGYTLLDEWRVGLFEIHWLFRQDYNFW